MFKRAFLTLAAIVGMTAAVSAQGIGMEEESVYYYDQPTTVYKSYNLAIGPKVGVNYSLPTSAKNMKDLDLSGNIGFSAGLAADLRFGRPANRSFGAERFGVQVEALYALKQLKTADQFDNISMNCFEVPVLFQWYFVPTFALEVGPTFTGAFPTTKDFKYGKDIYQLNKAKGMDVMVTFGLNCHLRNGFTADLRYNLGNSDLAGNFQTKVSTISLGFGWLFNVIK